MITNSAHFTIPGIVTTLVLVAGILAPTTARAQNVDLKLFDPVPGPHALLGVHSSRPLGHLVLWAGLTTSYANELLVGYRNGDTVMRPVAHRVVGELALSVGLFDWVDVAFSLPVFLRQLGEDYPMAGEDSAKTGLGDLRLLIKGQFLKNARFSGFGLALVAELGMPTGEADAFMRSQHVTFTPRLVLDYRHPKGYVVALNLGARIRSRQMVETLAVGSEIRLGLGAEAPLGHRGLSAVGELVAAIGLARQSQEDAARVSTQTSPLEARLAVRWRHPSSLVVTVGAGVGITDGYGSPDLRVLVAVGYAFQLAGSNRLTPSPLPATTRPVVAQRRTTPARRVTLRPPVTVGPRKISDADFDRAAARDPDPDADGLPNSRDKCPHQAEDMDGFQDTDGCPEPDNDQDGVPDKHDQCPLRPETVNGIKDDDGCPDKGAAQVVLTGSKLKISQRIYFHTGSDKLKPSAFPILRQVAAFLKAHWRVRRIRIEGHTDNRGDKEKNVDLSVRRAYRVRAFLVAQGVGSERLLAKGYGPKSPVASNRTPRGRARNRRVVFSVMLVVKKRGAK